MALAAFISARSQIEFYESEVDRERYEIKRFPEHERDEIRGIYKAKGFSGPLLDQIVTHITGDPDRWADVMMREELGFTEENFESPLKSSLVVGVSYLAGAAVPVAPYLFVAPPSGIAISVIITVLVLFAVGAAKTIVTARSWWRSGIESMLTGIAAGAVTYGAGRLFGGPRQG
jgi:VIT1/CCC1 family predicted Fe2+/Mn2+ transporter